MMTFFACFPIFVLIFFFHIFRFYSLSTKQRQMRQQVIVVIQNMFGDICNKNSISVTLKAIYSAITNVIGIKKLKLLTIHISLHSWQTSKLIFLSIKVY